MCFIFCMLCVRNLCSSLGDVSLFSCGNRIVVCVCHSYSSYVICSWKCVSILLRWIPPFFMRNNVLVVGDLIQSWYLILCMSCAPPCFASICCVRPL